MCQTTLQIPCVWQMECLRHMSNVSCGEFVAVVNISMWHLKQEWNIRIESRKNSKCLFFDFNIIFVVCSKKKLERKLGTKYDACFPVNHVHILSLIRFGISSSVSYHKRKQKDRGMENGELAKPKSMNIARMRRKLRQRKEVENTLA